MFQRITSMLVLLFAVVSADAQSSSTLPLPPDWHPESLDVGPDGSFYVGSWRKGAVVRVSTKRLPSKIIVQQGSNGLANGQGVLVDAKHDALWVCSGAVRFTTVPLTASALKRYSLTTGYPVASYLMPESGHCNDVARDSIGNLYVTDSFHPRILRLAAGGHALSIWKSDPALLGPGPYIGLNGIAIDLHNNLYVSLVAATDHILKVSITTGGSGGDVVVLRAPRILKNVDAIRFWKTGKLILFESKAFGDGLYGGRITLAELVKNDIILRPLVSGLNDPSSGLIYRGRLYFIESKYALLTEQKGNDAAVPRGVPFDIQSVRLP